MASTTSGRSGPALASRMQLQPTGERASSLTCACSFDRVMSTVWAWKRTRRRRLRTTGSPWSAGTRTPRTTSGAATFTVRAARLPLLAQFVSAALPALSLLLVCFLAWCAHLCGCFVRAPICSPPDFALFAPQARAWRRTTSRRCTTTASRRKPATRTPCRGSPTVCRSVSAHQARSCTGSWALASMFRFGFARCRPIG